MKLSELASAINEGYWSVDDPNGFEVVNRAIAEFAEFASNGTPYTLDDTEVSPLEFIEALAEIVRYKEQVNS